MARAIIVYDEGNRWMLAEDACITIITNDGYAALEDGLSPQDLGDDAIIDLGMKVYPNTGV